MFVKELLFYVHLLYIKSVISTIYKQRLTEISIPKKKESSEEFLLALRL